MPVTLAFPTRSPRPQSSTSDADDAQGSGPAEHVPQEELADPLRAFVRQLCASANMPDDAEDVAAAMASLREGEGVRVHIDDPDHLALLLARMVELNSRRS